MNTSILEEHITAIFRQKSSKQGKLEGYADVVWEKMIHGVQERQMTWSEEGETRVKADQWELQTQTRAITPAGGGGKN